MPRRIKTKKERASAKAVLGKRVFAKAENPKSNLRFNVSLVFLIATLSISVYLLLFTLTQNGKANLGFGNSAVSVLKAGPANSFKAVSSGKNQFLNDSVLDFKLAIPSQLGQWMYRVGYVKGLTDDSLTNQFAKIYIVQKPAGSSASFDDCYKDVLTIRKFSMGEWKELEKGCNKGNQIFCDGAGTKMDEKDGSVWAYINGGSCSGETKADCANIEKIIKSFQFK